MQVLCPVVNMAFYFNKHIDHIHDQLGGFDWQLLSQHRLGADIIGPDLQQATLQTTSIEPDTYRLYFQSVNNSNN